MLVVGVPKEIKPLEKRVGLSPSCVRSLTQKGVRVLIESGAGEKSCFLDKDYEKAGAELVCGPEKVYGVAGLIQKVKEPQPAEFPLLRSGQTVFGFLHLASPENCELVKVLQEKKVTAIGYETLETGGQLPLLAPMSEIAGALSSAYAAFYRNNPEDKWALPRLETIAAQFPDFADIGDLGNVVIWGGGVAGHAALSSALKFRGHVTVIEKNPARREALKPWAEKVADPCEDLTQVLKDADVLIGSVHVRGMRAVQVLTPQQMAVIGAAKKKIIMDISIDQGGNFPESRATTYREPVFRDTWGNLRFCVANIPSLCGRAASEMLARAALPYTIKLAQGIKEALEDADLKRAVNTQGGNILIPGIGQAHEKTTDA